MHKIFDRNKSQWALIRMGHYTESPGNNGPNSYDMLHNHGLAFIDMKRVIVYTLNLGNDVHYYVISLVEYYKRLLQS